MNNRIEFENFNEEILTDVVVIGAGAAGIRAAIEAADNNQNIIIVCKGGFVKSGSTFYPTSHGWGIQFLTDNGRRSDEFLKEILRTGEGMVIPELAKILIEETPSRVYDLEKFGINFHKEKERFYDEALLTLHPFLF